MKRYLALTLTVAAVVMLLASAPALVKDCWYYESYGKHDYEQTDVGYASCTESGYTEYECSRCGKTRKESIKALGHKYSRVKLLEAASCLSKGSEMVSCSRCGAQTTRSIDKTDHSYGPWQVSIEASDSSKGVRSRSCTTQPAARSSRRNIIPREPSIAAFRTRRPCETCSRSCWSLAISTARWTAFSARIRSVRCAALPPMKLCPKMAWPGRQY